MCLFQTFLNTSLLKSKYPFENISILRIISLLLCFQRIIIVMNSEPILLLDFFTQTLTDGFSLEYKDNKSHELSRTLLSILADFIIFVVWIVSIIRLLKTLESSSPGINWMLDANSADSANHTYISLIFRF